MKNQTHLMLVMKAASYGSTYSILDDAVASSRITGRSVSVDVDVE